MLSTEQQKDKYRLLHFIERECLTSCMNNTKWVALIRAIEAVPDYWPSFRVRCVMDPLEYVPENWDFSFPWHVPTYQFIEWLELNPVVPRRHGELFAKSRDFTQQLWQALLVSHVPFSIEGEVIRIWGYLRPDSSPNFVCTSPLPTE